MRRSLLVPAGLSLVLALLASTSTAEARPGGGPGGKLGLGLMVGEPSGVSMQLELGGPIGFARIGTALNLGIGLDILGDNGLHGHLDYVWLVDDLVQSGSVQLPFYIGVGAFFADRKGVGLGARMPVGVQIDFQKAPVQIFAEIALRLLLIDEVDLDVAGAIGFRYFF
jgi:hypothetical protein